jgi:hypothetical protein
MSDTPWVADGGGSQAGKAFPDLDPPPSVGGDFLESVLIRGVFIDEIQVYGVAGSYGFACPVWRISTFSFAGRATSQN